MTDPTRSRYDPRRPEPDDTTPYGLSGDDAPAPPEEPPAPGSGEGPQPRKKPRRADYRKVEPDPRYVDRLLEPRPKPKRKSIELPWGVVPAVLSGVGFVLAAVPIASALDKARTGVAAGVMVLMLVFVAVGAQTLTLLGALTALSKWLGIDYGPPRRMVVQLVSISLFASGMGIALMSLGGPLALVLAIPPAMLAFGAMFHLDSTDMTVTLIVLTLAATGAVCGVVGAMLIKFG